MSERPARPYGEAVEQPMPHDGKANVNAVSAALLPRLLLERQAKGLATYGKPLETWNGRDALTDLLDELVDGIQYAVQARMERNDMAREIDRLTECLRRAKASLREVRELLTDTDGCTSWLDVVVRIDSLLAAGLGEGSQGVSHPAPEVGAVVPNRASAAPSSRVEDNAAHQALRVADPATVAP